MGETDVLCAVLGAIRGRCEAAVAAEYRVVRGNSAKPWNPMESDLPDVVPEHVDGCGRRELRCRVGSTEEGKLSAPDETPDSRHLMRLSRYFSTAESDID